MIVGILQARTSSRRLPGKVLKPILGRPMLERQLERLKRARKLDALLVATSADASDDAIVALCSELGVRCFRGSLDDVLDRFYQAACAADARTVVRLTGDCPLADPGLIDKLVALHVGGTDDYTSNTLRRSFPDGLDAEVMRMSCLAAAWRDARLSSEREHVTPFIYHHPDRFRLGNLSQERDFSAMRWVVDDPADFEFVSSIYGALYPARPDFGTDDILALLQSRPDIAARMGGAKLNEGYELSLRADAAAAEKGKGTD